MATPNNTNNQSVLPDYWYNHQMTTPNNQSTLPDYWYNNQIGAPNNTPSPTQKSELGDYLSSKWNSFNNNYWNKNAGIGDYGTWVGADGSRINVDKNAFDSIAQAGDHGGQLIKTDKEPGFWDSQGPSGRSRGGNILGGVAAGVGALSGLAGMYYGYEQMKMQKELNKLQKDAYNRQVKKDEQQEARLKQLAKNVGNSATY